MKPDELKPLDRPSGIIFHLDFDFYTSIYNNRCKVNVGSIYYSLEISEENDKMRLCLFIKITRGLKDIHMNTNIPNGTKFFTI